MSSQETLKALLASDMAEGPVSREDVISAARNAGYTLMIPRGPLPALLPDYVEGLLAGLELAKVLRS